MPYYRIRIYVKGRSKPYSGIRQIAQSDVDIVFRMIEKEVYKHYNEALVVDYEVQQLPKTCTAVKKYLERSGMKVIKGDSNFINSK